ncbi:SDR family oxidoreductase [Amycolatopsis sp. NPDC050768]|uniref:SDR family NAD(P)-dependent oxidoreductase n=1 Tax=Amycolatopsis sp. NPDC050768 TaxID=3154839 RepID=UPI0033FDA3FD
MSTQSLTVGALSGRTAVIYGGSAGIGFATARLFIAEGAQVYLTGRREAELDAAADDLGTSAHAVPGDLASAEDRTRLYDRIRADGHRIDVLFLNAGVGAWGTVENTTPADFDHVMSINLKGSLFALQEAVPLLNERASVIITGSIAAQKANPQLLVYSVSKAALRSVVRNAAVTLADRGIRVNMLTPGTTDTDIIAPFDPYFREQLKAGILAGRFGTPRELAEGALFLASDRSSFMTGAELVMDGGVQL